MLIATLAGQLVDAQNAKRQPGYRCPACHQLVDFRHGTQVQAYFAHRRQQPCPFASEGETTQHVLGKRQLAAFFRPWGPVTLEHVLPEIKQRADGWVARQPQPVAIEFQCSPISSEQVAARTQGYRQIGVYPCWVLGQRYAHQKLHWPLIEKFACWLTGWGLCLLYWDVTRQQLRVDHHLHQDATGQYGCWTTWVTTLAELLAGSAARLWVPPVNFRRFRAHLDHQLQRAVPALRPLQESLYVSGRHLAGFPAVFTTHKPTPPIFGQGLLLWRIMLGAWLFTPGGLALTPEVVSRLAHQGLGLIGGHCQAVRFNGEPALRQAQTDLLADLVAAGYLEVVLGGWQIKAEPQWNADYTAWLENDEKRLG